MALTATIYNFDIELAGGKIHRADTLELYAIDRALVGALVARLERRVAFSLSTPTASCICRSARTASRAVPHA